ncbi:hypothetical protein IQ283_03735 [Alkalihalobacillus hwajinpoensis]|nr:hypothetical protein [Pseudalkalibacillus hwajinpoensis]
MKQQLQHEVKNGTNDPNRFHVYAWEAGLGKSTHVNNSIREYFNDHGFESNVNKYLIVKKFKTDVYETVEQLEKSDALKMYGDYGVLGITGDNIASYTTEQVRNCKVLVITHTRYIAACEKELIESFGKRDVLIIDEQVQFPVMKFGRAEYNTKRQQIHLYEGQALFDKCLLPLLDWLDTIYKEKEYNNIITFKGEFCKEPLNDFKKWVKKNTNAGRKNKYNELVQEIESLYNKNNLGFIHNDTLFFIDQGKRFRKLKSNIILDASADITPLYQLKNHFNVVEKRLSINHSQSKIMCMPVNTSKSGMKNYRDNIIKDIQHRLRKMKNIDKQALIVCHKENSTELLSGLKQTLGEKIYIPNEESMEEEALQTIAAVDWYGNIVGKNTYREYDICMIVGTFNMPLPVYLLQFFQYNRQVDPTQLPDKLELESGHFKSEKFEEIRKAFVAADFYQAARRIQRNQNPKAVYILYTYDEDVLHAFKNKFKDIGDVLYLNRESIMEKEVSPRKEKAIQMLMYIAENVEVGELIAKQNLAHAISVSESNFSRYLKNDVMQKHVEQEDIEIRNKDIIKKSDFVVV